MTIIDLTDIGGKDNTVDYIVNTLYKESNNCIGELLTDVRILNASVEDVVEIWARCMSEVEGDTIVQFLNYNPDLNLLSEGSDEDHIVLGK